MQKQLLYISEEHIGENATPSDAKRIVELLRVNGWTVAYGDRPWQFENEQERSLFEQAFKWAMAVITAEKQPFDKTVWIDLARQRIEQNANLHPYKVHLFDKRPGWSGYLGWLIESPVSVILNWLEIVWKKKDASKD